MNRLVWMLVPCLFVFIQCGGNNGATSSLSGSAINSTSNALKSITNLVSSRMVYRGGIANSFCNANGTPLDNNGNVLTSSDNEYPAAVGFCQATHNAQSPDNARGAMYIAGGMSCEAAKLNLFDGLSAGASNSASTDVEITTDCWGTQAEVNAFIADISSSTLSGATITVTQLASSSAYDYSVSFTLGSGGSGVNLLYLKASNGIYAALNSDWAFKFDTTTGTFLYEGINNDNVRRMRLLVQGTLSAALEYSSISSIKGFWYQGNSGFGTGVNFNGDLSLGLIGDVVVDGSGVTINDKCHLPGSTGSCTGISALSTPEVDFDALYANRVTAATNLANYTSALISFTDIDSSDYDLTD